MPSSEVSPAPSPRQMRHLIGMCDGKRHCFLDHELAAEMRNLGWIERDCGDWRITEKGRAAVVNGGAAGAGVFDICDGRNRYRPCPRCGVEVGMGIRNGAVECAECGFRGPSYPLGFTDITASDRAAFDAWNALERRSAPA